MFVVRYKRQGHDVCLAECFRYMRGNKGGTAGNIYPVPALGRDIFLEREFICFNR